jgi:hypothetical protein
VSIVQLVELKNAEVVAGCFIALTKKGGEDGLYGRVGCARAEKPEVPTEFRSRLIRKW